MSKQFQVDQLIGEYRVTHFLGEGGMGEVYLGIHEKLGRKAAIKILGSGSSDESFKTRFFNEARLQASLHHPNIAALYDFQELGDQLLIFMEFIDGESLEDLVERRAFAIDDTLNAFQSICEAVGYIHQNGIVHRDIKSQNVKMSATGTAKLLDFGIAKDAASLGLTHTGGVIGTPNYLAPELLEGKPATPRSDVWALGILLYEMLTGCKPFDGDTLGSLVLQITTGQFVPPDNLNPAVPREVSAVVKRCLKKSAGDRYADAGEIAAEVRRIIDRRASGAKSHVSTFGFRPAAVVADTIVNGDPDYGYAESSIPAARGTSPTMLYVAAGSAVAVLMLIVVAVVGFWAFSGNSDGAKSSVPAQASPKNINSIQAGGNKEGQKRVRVDLDEGKAQVLRNGELLGSTPLDVDVAAGETPKLTLHRDGFEDKDISIESAGGKKVFTFSLTPKK
ncbi:MAG: serine/threonine-protein kinase [Acidobacteriota bacterium]